MIKSLTWLIFFVAAPLVIIYLSGSIFISLLVAGCLAYLVNPAVNFFENIGIPRRPTCILVFMLTLAILLVIFGFVFPIIAKESINLIKGAPDLIANLQIQIEPLSDSLRQTLINFGIPKARLTFITSDLTFIREALASMDTKLLAKISGGFIFSSFLNIIESSLSFLAFLIITPVAFYYLLYSFNTLKTKFLQLILLKHQNKFKSFLKDADKVLSGYFRGMILLIIALTIYYTIAYKLLSLNFGIGLGFFGGLAAIVPYLGTFLHAVLLSCLVLYQFGIDWTTILIAIAIFATGQLLENLVLTPYLFGKSLGLHPLVVIFIFLIFGTLFGVAGLVIALPVSTLIILVYKYILNWLNES